jgi:uncharacterized membrane protein YtjA (UPF0391 family)
MFISMGITYLLLTIIAGVFGFGVLTDNEAWIAKGAFFTFLIAFLISFVMTGQQSTEEAHRKNT